MARLPRLILPGMPYHVTQRGNRRAPTFFEDGDYLLYRDLLAEAADDAAAWRALRQSETSGRPVGGPGWIAMIEARTGRTLAPQKRGPKPKIAIRCIG